MDDIKLALKLLENKFKLFAKVLKDERYIIFDGISSRKIDKIILKNIPNGLDVVQYKIINNNICKKNDGENQ